MTKGYTYRVKVVYAHFPISVKTKGDEILVENFVGERSPRVAKIVGACKVTVEGDDVIVKGVSLEDVGQTAANVELATKIKRKDQRVFLDGSLHIRKIGGLVRIAEEERVGREQAEGARREAARVQQAQAEVRPTGELEVTSESSRPGGSRRAWTTRSGGRTRARSCSSGSGTGAR